jgi:hypothetical protein
MRWHIVIPLIALLLVAPVLADIPCPVCDAGSGTGWFTEFNVSNENTTWWGGDNSSWTTNSPPGIAETDDQNAPLTFLGNRSLNGTFIWNIRMFNETTTTGSYMQLVFGSQCVDAAGTSPSSGCNKYYMFLYNEIGWLKFYLYKRAGGSNTALIDKTIGWNTNKWYNITVQWEPGNTTKIIVKRDNVYIGSTNDATYLSGYAGFSSIWEANREQVENVSFAYQPTGGAAPSATTYDATFSCTQAAVRNGTITCTNKSAGDVTWFGNGSVPCLSSSKTPNLNLFSLNYSYCNICLTVKDTDLATTNTSCKLGSQGPYIMQPWVGF